MVDSNLGFNELTAGQSNKETTVNTALGRLSSAGNEGLVVDLTSADVDLTDTQQSTNIWFRAQNNSVARTLGLNTNVGAGANTAERLCIISNEGTAALTVDDADAGGGSSIVIPAGVTAIVQVDGTNINLVMSDGNASAVSDWKESVRVATTTNGTLATAYESGDTVDGVTLATGDRILLKDQTTGSENGIYTVNASGAPTRATDFVDPLVTGGAAVVVEEGTANADTIWGVTNNGVVDVGTDAITFAELGGGGASTLTGLTDTPSSYTSQALKILRVNSTPDAVEFVDHNHDLACQYAGSATSAKIWKYIATRALTIPANLAGTQGHWDTAPSGGAVALDLQKNGASVGTITFADASQVETGLATSGGTAVSVAVGDRLSIHTPANLFSAAGLALTIKAILAE